MRSTEKKEDKTKVSVKNSYVASNTRSKTNNHSTCVVNITNNSEKDDEKLQKKRKPVRKRIQDTASIHTNGTQSVEINNDLVDLLDICPSKKEIPKKSEDGSDMTAFSKIVCKTAKMLVEKIDAVSNKKPNVRRKESRGIIYDDPYLNLRIKQLNRIKNKKKTLSNRKLLKKVKDPPDDVHNSHKNPYNNGLPDETEDLVVNKLSNIVIQRNFSENINGCDNKRKICNVWSTNLKTYPPKTDVVSKNLLESDLKDEKITNILNSVIDCTNLSDVESTTTYSNLSSNSNCALCVDVPKEKEIIQRTNNDSDTNPFVKYRLETCDLNIKITKTLQKESMPSTSSRICKRSWAYNYYFQLQTCIIRITSKDSIFCGAILEKGDAVQENKITTKCVLNTENLRNDNSQKCSPSSSYNFILPLLPLSKRPPTRRPVTTAKSTEDDHLMEASLPEDDAISLYACPEMDPECFDDNINKKVIDRSDNIGNKNYNIKEITNSKTNSTPEKHEKGESKPPRLTSATYHYIPNVFRGVCYYHFTQKNCRRKHYCPRLHGLYPNTEENILNLSYEELSEVYNFTKGKMFYKETFPFFINAYVKHKKVLDLANIVRDVIDQDMFERSPFIEKIVEAIQSIGYSFHQAIEEIITILGITNLNLCLSDILINIVVRSSGDLEADWPLIKKLTKYRTDKVDHGVVEDIVRISADIKSVQLCLSTFRDMLNTQIVNLEYLNVELLKRFVFVLRQLNLVEESKILAEKANIPSNDDNVVNDINTNDANGVVFESCSNENNPYQLEENVSFKSFSGSERIYENSYECDYDNASASMPYSEAGIATPNFSDTILSNNNSTKSEISCVSKNIPTKAISSLTSIIKNKDVSRFLGILEQFKAEDYAESFVLKAIELLEKEDLHQVYKIMNKIFNTIPTDKYKHRFWLDSQARYLIECLSFNVIALFDRKNSWKQAANIIKKFANDYVNFAKAKCTKFHKYDYTELGKYLYFCKIFIRAGYLQDTYELLMDPDLRLLNEKTTWTIAHHQSFDSSFRDDVVKKFLIKSISIDVDLAKKLILHIIQDASCIINIDVWHYYNDLLVALMYNHHYQDILDMLDNILNGWNLKLKKEVFRSLLIILLRLPDVNSLNIMTLYVCACKRGFYTLHTGMEKEIILKTDMLYEEIYLILHMFFYKKASCNLFESDDLCLKLQLAETVDERPSFLFKSNVSINDFRIKIYRVLAVAFYHPICVDETHEMFSIIVDKKQLEILLRFYKNQNTFFV